MLNIYLLGRLILKHENIKNVAYNGFKSTNTVYNINLVKNKSIVLSFFFECVLVLKIAFNKL